MNLYSYFRIVSRVVNNSYVWWETRMAYVDIMDLVVGLVAVVAATTSINSTN